MDGIQLAFALVIELWKLITGNNIEPPQSPTFRQEVRKLDQTLKKYKLICENQINSVRKLVSFIEKKSAGIPFCSIIKVRCSLFRDCTEPYIENTSLWDLPRFDCLFLF